MMVQSSLMVDDGVSEARRQLGPDHLDSPWRCLLGRTCCARDGHSVSLGCRMRGHRASLELAQEGFLMCLEVMCFGMVKYILSCSSPHSLLCRRAPAALTVSGTAKARIDPPRTMGWVHPLLVGEVFCSALGLGACLWGSQLMRCRSVNSALLPPFCTGSCWLPFSPRCCLLEDSFLSLPLV